MKSVTVACAVLAAAVTVGCDKDPTSTRAAYTLQACPGGGSNSRIDVNAPIVLTLTGPTAPASVAAGNVVLTDAATGVEIPGALTLANTASGSTVTFAPRAALPYNTRLRIRIQNLLRAGTNEAIDVTVCELTTQLPPITQLFWNRLPDVTGNQLVGASLFQPDSGYVVSFQVPIYRRTSTGWVPLQSPPYYNRNHDVAFLSRTHGFSSPLDRSIVPYVIETRDAGATFDTVASGPRFETINRLWVVPNGSGGVQFGVAAGGGAGVARFYKYRPSTSTFTSVQSITGMSNIVDVSFPSGDTLRGAAVSSGFRSTGVTVLGRVLTTSDGGTTWAEIPNSTADNRTVVYLGVARRSNGEVFAAGGNGTLMRFTPAGGGFTRARVTGIPGAVSPDTSNFQALIFTDVEFAPGNDQLGWLIGAQLVSRGPGAPTYQGMIWETTDGGATWVRQGVKGAPNFGAEFPRLNRITALSASAVWLVGDGGVVLTYKP